MPEFKALLFGKVKDKASIGKARLVHSFSSNSVKNIHLALLKSTTHSHRKPPDSDYVSDVISYSNSRYAPAAFAAALWRIRVTKNAFVANKSLIVLHKLIKSSRDTFEGLDPRWNNLKLREFWDKSSSLAQELSHWVRWYGLYLDHLSWISKVLGSFPSFMETSKDRAKVKDRVSSYKTGYIMRQTDSLVCFFEHICTRPESPPMFQNKIVDEIRELVIQDYFAVMMLIVVRLQVLSERLIKLGVKPVGDSGLSLVLVRLEECKESLSGFFWRYRRLAEDFWCLVEMLKAETAKDNKEMVEFVGSVQKTVKDDEEMVELAGSVQTEWVTFDDTETATHEVVPWDSEWVKFDDPNGLTNESVWLSLCT
ncbi:PREDICTED: putative clathrin assembly protein At5g10410 [Camelina sativa]|uniref:Clathrin assembly protein At5g10410 n=1 Tax=Camelina sativa TaxID=90675 RepID=A0ABM0T9C8_CAMSA|nr:PREDICTED: putative clathrin assembly protein At5g10410 [Camelina sativa]